jgi:asparagine synthase (glutamine-hydrolysing)
MASPDARYTILYNGEIFNFRELRVELERAGICIRNPLRHRSAAARLRGMGLFAARAARRHVCVRDLGRPQPDALRGARPDRRQAVFLLDSPAGRLRSPPRLRRSSRCRIFRGGWISRRCAISLRFRPCLRRAALLADVRQLAPASSLSFEAATRRLAVRRYWEIPPPGAAPCGLRNERVALVDAALRESVRRQLGLGCAARRIPLRGNR